MSSARRGSAQQQDLVGAAVLGIVGAVCFVALAVVALGTRSGQRLDEHALYAISGPPGALRRFLDITSVVSVGSVAVMLLACVLLALTRRRLAAALGAVVLVAGACTTTELLKHVLLPRPDLGWGTLNSLPSGHTTVALSLALASVLVAPAVARRWVAVAGAFVATLMGTALLVAHFHRPSDVLAAVMVCAVWSGVALAVVVLGQHRDPSCRHPRTPRLTHAGAVLSAAAVGVLVLSWGVRPEPGEANLPLAVVALGAVGLGCALLLAGFARAVDDVVG